MPTEGTPTPTYPQYTNKALGEGLFDQLMTAVKHHLEEEYKKQRITGNDYSKVYLGSMESVMGNATQYLLGLLLIDEKQEQLAAQIELTQEQARQAAYETDYILPKQLEKLDAEIALIGSQKLLTDAQADKVGKEIEFLDAKIRSEQANTIAGIAEPDSLMGRQIALLEAQRLGFAGDLQSKVGKVFADYDAVFQSVQESPDDSALALDARTSLNTALNVAAEITGVPYTPPVINP